MSFVWIVKEGKYRNRIARTGSNVPGLFNGIADVTGGQYFRAKDPRTLMEIYALIDQLEPVEQEAEIFRPVQSLYFWPLGGSLLVWVLVLSWDFRRRLQITSASHA